MTEPRARTTIYVAKRPNGPVPRWAVRVAYPGGKPTTLVSCTSEDEAIRTARAYAARYGWLLDHGDEDEK